MRRAILCAPNVSEGRDAAVIDALVEAIRAVAGVRLLDCAPDPDHHRTVLTYLGEPEAVLEATVAMADVAFDRIDMRRHGGQHPRLGAVDVVPFVPVRGVSMEEAVELARRFGRFAAERGVPVYYYEEAARRLERRELPAIRSGEYEGLEARLATSEGRPDEGPARFNAEAGAVVTGARPPLVRLNVNLRTTDLFVAETIARSVREIGGGLPHVRAIWIALRKLEMVQVSLNLTRPDETSIPTALEAVHARAAELGIEVAGSQIVGPVPFEALLEATRHYLGAPDLEGRQVIELALVE